MLSLNASDKKTHLFADLFHWKAQHFRPFECHAVCLEDFDGLQTLDTSLGCNIFTNGKKTTIHPVACCTPHLSQEKLLGSAVRPSRANMPWPENRCSQRNVGFARCQNGSSEVDLLLVVQLQFQHWSQKAQVHGFQRLTEWLELFMNDTVDTLYRSYSFSMTAIPCPKWVLSCAGGVITGRGGPGRWMAHSYHTCVYKGISVL